RVDLPAVVAAGHECDAAAVRRPGRSAVPVVGHRDLAELAGFPGIDAEVPIAAGGEKQRERVGRPARGFVEGFRPRDRLRVASGQRSQNSLGPRSLRAWTSWRGMHLCLRTCSSVLAAMTPRNSW